MTKKNLKPQQTAPVQREINTTSLTGGIYGALTPLSTGLPIVYGTSGPLNPFAGDDAE